MRMRTFRPKRFQMGGGAGGTAFTPQAQQNPALAQQLAAARFGAGAAPGAGLGATGASPFAAAQANPLAQQMAARGAVPTAGTTTGAVSPAGVAAFGGMPVASSGMVQGAATPVQSNFQPRPGMGWGSAPGAGPMGVPAGGGSGMAGAGGQPGVTAGMPGTGGQPQSVMGALAGRGTGAPGAGMPGASVNPAIANQLAALQTGAGVGMARGGRVVPRKGTTGPIRRTPENSFDSTGHVGGNLAIRPGTKKEPLARARGGGIGGRVLRHDETPGTAPDRPVDRGRTTPGGRIVGHSETAGTAPDRAVRRSGNRTSPNVGTTGPIERGPVNRFDSTASVGDNLRTRPGRGKEPLLPPPGPPIPPPPLARARGGVVRRRPAATSAAVAGGDVRREDRRSPSPLPYYDMPRAGEDGWPPTPNFSSAPGANLPAPFPNPTPTATSAPTFRRGGKCVEDTDKDGMAEGGRWIKDAIRRPGALRRQLGVREGERIPAGKLAKAARAPGKLGQRARLAETLRGFHKAEGGECDDRVLVRPSRRAAEARREEEREGRARGGKVLVPPSRAAAEVRREEEREEGRARGGRVKVRPSRRAAEARREEERERGKRKGGACDKMAAGGAAKERRGFPNTIPHPGPKRLASGGTVRGTGAAERGTHFSGIY